MTTIDTRSPAATQLVHAVATTPLSDPCREQLRLRAIEVWLPLAHRLARRYAGEPSDLDDLCQVATVGLIKAIDGFDPEWGDDFVAYAVPKVAGELKRHFRDRCWSIRPPRPLHDLYLRIHTCRPRLAQRLGHPPTAAEVSRDLGVGVEEVLEALECAYTRRVGSLSARVRPDSGIELSEVVAAEEDAYRAAELRLDLHRALAELDDREQQIIVSYFFGNQTQDEIGRRLGYSQMHISRLLHKALATLRGRLTAATP